MVSYIIRIYQERENSHRGLVGTVEEVGADRKRAFTNINELWEILIARNGGDEGGIKRMGKPDQNRLKSK